MPLIDITNPDIIKFLIENYDKTTRLKLKWNRLHADKLQAAASFHREEKGYVEADVIKEGMVTGLAATTRDHLSSTRNRRIKPIKDRDTINGISEMKKGHSIVEVGLGDPNKDPRLAKPDTDLSLEPIMRPVDPEQMAILYKSIPSFGREVYLKKRVKTKPEDKYYFMECSGFVYGWRLKDSYFSQNAPKYGKVWRLTKDGKSRTGPQPDPAYYKKADIPGPDKCGKE